MTPDPPPAARRWTGGAWRRALRGALTERLPLKGTAILLAIVLWLIVNAKEPTQELVPVHFTPVLDSSLVVRDPLPEIQALVAGAPEDLIKLAATRLVIRRSIMSDAPDTLVLDIGPADVILPTDVAGRVQVQDVRPRSITLRFESTWTRMVTVRPGPVVTPDSLGTGPGGGMTAVRVDPSQVQVSGPRHVVLHVAFVRTVRAVISPTDSLPHLVDIDTANLGVRVKPPQVRLYVTKR